MPAIKWLPSATRQRREIHRYGVTEFSRTTADATDKKIGETASGLSVAPDRGKERSEIGAGVRTIRARPTPFILVYRHDAAADKVSILAVVHARQKWPPTVPP